MNRSSITWHELIPFFTLRRKQGTSSLIFVKIIIEGILLGALLVLFCAVGIRNGAVNMVFLYHQDVQDKCVKNGFITRENIEKNRKLFKGFGIPVYFIFVLVSTFTVNGARGFWQGFLQMFAILSVVNLIDRLLIDEYWVGHTKAWEIPGTEDMKPYINKKDKRNKWLMGTIGFAILSAVLSEIMSLLVK